MNLRTLKLAARLVWLDIKKERKFEQVSWKEATQRVVRRYQAKGQAYREGKRR